MTRYTKMGRKTFEKREEGGFEVKPLTARKQQDNGRSFDQGRNNKRNDFKKDGPPGRSGSFKRKREDDMEEGNRRTKDVCFACRKPGHSVNNCPKNKDHAKICYNCGSTEHGLKECRKPRKGNSLPYAKCYVCNQEGHLSGKCPKNEKGLYPNGGSCAICQQVDHYAKDCPVTKEQAGTTAVGLISADQGADDDDYHIFVENKQKAAEEAKREKKQAEVAKPVMKKKVVKF